MRVQSRRLGYVAEADLDDIASQKALELLRRFDQEGWSLADGAPGEVRAFLARVARNGLVDHLRRTGRRAEETLDEVRELRTDDLPGSSEELAAPDARVERSRFVDALVDCAGRLKPRDRTVWIFRAFYGMSSKEIARHPEVRLKPAHVDVLLKRVRDSLRACMKQKGYVPGDMPPGSFAAIWAAFRLRALPFVGGTHE
jgi:RNA polymerase sigma factor (sigma-70 family)